MTDGSDVALAKKAKHGNAEAFAVLVHRHINPLYGYAYRLTKSSASADDLVQDTWLAAWQAIGSFNPEKASLSTWLHRILHNKYIDTLRKSRDTLTDNEISELPDDHNVERSFTQAQRQQALNKLIDALPENQRSALVLYYMQGFTNAEVANILGIKLRAAESLIARARKALLKSFATSKSKDDEHKLADSMTSQMQATPTKPT